MLIIGLNHRFELPNTHHSILLSASRSLRQNILRGRVWGVRLSYSFPFTLHKMTILFNSFSVDVRRRSRNTSFDSTSHGNGRVKGMIASLELSSSSEDEDDNLSDNGGGRRSSSPNKSQRNSMFYFPTKDQRHSLSCSRSPNKTLPSRGTVH